MERPAAVLARPRPSQVEAHYGLDLFGYYTVGAARLDLSDLGRFECWQHPDGDEVRVDLADGVRLTIVDQAER